MSYPAGCFEEYAGDESGFTLYIESGQSDTFGSQEICLQEQYQAWIDTAINLDQHPKKGIHFSIELDASTPFSKPISISSQPVRTTPSSSPSQNLAKIFSNKGLAPNCMVILAVVIKILFRV